MSTLSRVIATTFLLVAGTVVALADDPAPLVKPVVPTGNSVRVRVPVIEDKRTPTQFKARIPNPRGKKGEAINVKVALDTISDPAAVTLKTWQGWGFEVPNNRVGVIPELIVPGAQFAPKPAKGGDVEFRVANVKVNIIEATATDPVVPPGCDLYLPLRDLTGGADRAFEPRLHFGDKFLELTIPGPALKRLNTADLTPPDTKATAGDLVPAFGQLGTSTVFAFASVNGHTQYTTPTGKVERVNAVVTSLSGRPAPGIVMTLNTARGCGVFLEKQPGDGETVTGKVKELRLGLLTGPGFKAQKDFVLKDVTVRVDDDKTRALIWLGPRFVEAYFTDGVCGCGSDGVWRLHGRVKPEHLEDIKTRTPPKKP